MDESYLSWLRLIPGVTADLAKRVAERYPDPELLRGASPKDLAEVTGMTEEVALRVLELVHTASTSDSAWYRDEPGLYLCPECGSFVGKGASACPFCGVVFDEGEESAPEGGSPVEELLQARNGEAKICTRCGAFLHPGKTACGMCGAEYLPERLEELPAVDTSPVTETDLFLCPHCGAFLGRGAARCTICGKGVAAEEKVPGLARKDKGVSKDFLTRWQRAAEEEAPAAPAPPAPRTLEDELREYERLLEADPSLVRGWVRKGRILITLGRGREAVEAFDRAGQLDPAQDSLYRSEILEALGPTDRTPLPSRWVAEPEAARIADEMRREAATLAPSRTEEEPAPRTQVAERPQEVEPAPEEEISLEDLEADVAEAPREPETPAVTSAEAASIRRALAYYDRLLAMDSGLRVAWQTKGELLLRLGRRDDAEACFQRGADLEVAERQFGREALTGLQTRGPRTAPTNGATGTGRTNGRTNGLTNGRRGRTNGSRGRTNGLTNGSDATNGLTNGLGRVNGLMSGLARGEGRTNGLVNGNGFTNGRRGRIPTAFPRARREWARSVVGIASVVLIMILAPIVASMLAAPPQARGIVIDGSFGDWAREAVLFTDPIGDAPGNPDVDLVGYKVATSDMGLFAYARVLGTAFRGANGTADVLVALIDADGKNSTGYDAGRVGADYAVELVGWDGVVRETPLYRWNSASNRTDWFGFDYVEPVPAAASQTEVEFSLGINAPTYPNARIALATVDALGRGDATDAVVEPGEPALGVAETAIAPAVISTLGEVAVLRLDLSPAGPPVAVSFVNVTTRGSLPDAAVTLSLYRDNGDGVLGPVDALEGTAAPAGRAASFPLSLSLNAATTLFVTATLSVLPANETFGVALGNVDAAAVVAVSSADLTLSYIATAPEPTVDGAFGDWSAVPRTADPVGDVANRGGVSALANANVDLTEVGSFLGSNASFYLRVDGTMLGGIDVPNLRERLVTPATDSDLDSVPDSVELNLGPGLAFDFNNDGTWDANTSHDVDQDGVTDWPNGQDLWLNTTIPAWYPVAYAGRIVQRYIGPIAPQKLDGVDSAIVYLDADNSTATGLIVTTGPTTYGLDWAIVVVGRHGTVLSSELFGYVRRAGIPWDPVASLPAAVDATRLEVAAPNAILNLSASYRTLYYATDWRLSYDFGVPVPPGRSPAPPPGTRSPAGDNVVINEVSPQPNPEWIELANPTSSWIGISGWVLQRQKGNKWEPIYTFSGSIGAWGSGSEYRAIDLPGNSLPNGQTTIRIVDSAGRVVDVTSYQPSGSGNTWARFKNPTTGKPMDSDNDASDFYVSAFPSKGGPNDRHRPTIAVAKTANKATAAPGDLITYTIYYNNTDTGRANHVWVNDTLPAQVTFQSSGVAPTGSSGQTYFWHFANVGPNTFNSFIVTVRVNDGTGNGVSLVNKAALEYTDQLNRKMAGSTAWRNVTVWRPVITIAKIADKKVAVPGDTIVYTIFYNNTGFASAQHVWINDTLPADVTYQTSSIPPTSFSGQVYRWHFTNVAPGAHSFTITVKVNLNPTSSVLVNWVYLNYTTQNGWKLEESRSSWTTTIPEFTDFALVAVVPLVFLGMRRLRRRKE